MTDARPTLIADRGSYRDPTGRIYEIEGGIVRALDDRGLADHEAVAASGFFRRAVDAGQLIGTRMASSELTEAAIDLGWAGALEHDRVPVLSYPYEWSFSMRRDAALLHLQLVRDAAEEGIGCKDGSAYNVQFVGASPVFIDVGSFEPRIADGWPGYRQFCQHLLFPLLIEAHLRVDPAPWLRGSIEGIALEDAARLLRGRQLLRRGVVANVAVQALIARRSSDRPDRGRSAVASSQAQQLVVGLVDRLRRVIEDLPAPEAATAWTDYGARGHYERAALDAKDAFVRRAVEAGRPRQVVDLGCNDGRFSRIAAASGARVLALDADRAVIDRLYRDLASERSSILPLVADLADPSPSTGWASAERSGLLDRLHGDLVLSLAVIHHLIIGRNVPAASVLDLLATIGPTHVLEVPHRADPMVRRLLDAKPDHVHRGYRRSALLALVEERFEVIDELVLPGGTRTLLHLRRR